MDQINQDLFSFRLSVPWSKGKNEWKKINKIDLVPGDVVLLEGNFWICADIRIVNIMEPVCVESYFLYTDCHTFLKDMTVEQTSEDPLETSNLIFHGTSFFDGRCLGIVFQTGDNALLNDSDISYLSDISMPSHDEEK